MKTAEFLYTGVMSGTDLKGVVYFAYHIFCNGRVSLHKATFITYRLTPGIQN
jgi:hypothetical protein